MVFIKQVVNADAGDADHVGGNDWDILDKFFDAGINVATADINSIFKIRNGKLQLINPGNSAHYIINTGAITADRIITYPVLLADDVPTFDNHPSTLKNKSLDAATILNALTFNNPGAGANPSLISNSANQDLALTGSFFVSGNLQALGTFVSISDTTLGPIAGTGLIAKTSNTQVLGTVGIQWKELFSVLGTFSGLLTASSMSIGAGLNMNASLINNVLNPVADQDAATKKFVDDIIVPLESFWLLNSVTTPKTIRPKLDNYHVVIGATLTKSPTELTVHGKMYGTDDIITLSKGVTPAGTTVTGDVGSKFTEEVSVGDILIINSERHAVTEITSDTVLTTSAAYTGTSNDPTPDIHRVGMTLVSTNGPTSIPEILLTVLYDDPTNKIRVGIGTAEPQKELHIIGELRLTSLAQLGALQVDGNTVMGVAITNTIDTIARFINDLIPLADNSKSLGIVGKVWANVRATNAFFTDATITNSLNMSSKVISNVATPVAAADAANKAYVDNSQIAGPWNRVVPNVILDTITDNVGIGDPLPIAKASIFGDVFIKNRPTVPTAGTSTTTVGSVNVVGSLGSAYLTDFKIGDQIEIGPDIRTVDTIASDTALTVTEPFTVPLAVGNAPKRPSILSLVTSANVLVGAIDSSGDTLFTRQVNIIRNVAAEFGATTFNNEPDTHASFVGFRGRGTIASPLAILDNDEISILLASGYTGTTFKIAGLAGFVAGGNWTDISTPTKFEIGTVDVGSTALLTRITVLPNGDTGFGIALPTKKIDVLGEIKASVAIESLIGNFTTINSTTINATTLVTPTIASFINAQHNHSTGTAGGNLTNSALTTGIFAAIQGLGVQTQALNIGSNKIINLTDPTADQDAATKKFVEDSVLAGPWNKSGTNVRLDVLTDNVPIGLAAALARLHIVGQNPSTKPIVKIESASGAPTTVTYANTYLHLGGGEFLNTSFRSISFGFNGGGDVHPPAFLAYQELNTGDRTHGDIVIGTRPTNTDIPPTIRARFTVAGFLGLSDASLFNSSVTNPLTIKNGTINLEQLALLGSSPNADAGFVMINETSQESWFTGIDRSDDDKYKIVSSGGVKDFDLPLFTINRKSATIAPGGFGLGIKNPLEGLHQGNGNYRQDVIAPSEFITVGPLGAVRSIKSAGNFAFVAAGANFLTFDISTQQIPVQIASKSGFTDIKGISVLGDIVYFIHQTNGVRFISFDVGTNKKNPVAKTDLVIPGGDDSFLSGNFAFVNQTSNATVHFIDCTIPDKQTLFSSHQELTDFDKIRGIYVIGNTMYIVGDKRFSIYDVTDKKNITKISSLAVADNDLDGGSGIFVRDGLAYITADGPLGKFTIWDVSNPTVPVKQSGALSILATEIIVAGNNAYITEPTPANKFTVIDVSLKDFPVVAASKTGLSDPATLSIQGKVAFVGEIGGAGALKSFDITGIDVPSGQIGHLKSTDLEVLNGINVQKEITTKSLTAKSVFVETFETTEKWLVENYGLHTGVRSGLKVIFNSATTVDIEAGEAIIVNRNPDPKKITVTIVRFPGVTGLVDSQIGSPPATHFFLQSNGTIVQSTALPVIPDEIHDAVLLGSSFHPTVGTIVSVVPDSIQAHATTSQEIETLVLGGGESIDPGQLKKGTGLLTVGVASSATLIQFGRGVPVNLNSPNIVLTPALADILQANFFKVFVNQSDVITIDNGTNTIDTTQFNTDSNGTLDPVNPAKAYTIRVFVAGDTGNYIFYYPTKEYASVDEAMSLSEETFLEHSSTKTTTPIGKIFFLGNITDLSNATFLPIFSRANIL